MKIQKMTWQNFKGLADGEIVANGRDVIISGRNGAGKSSIASILPFVLFGKIAAKSFDERGITIETQIPTATIEFDTVTLKRSVTPRNQNRTFIDGEEVSATQFNAKVLEFTGGIGTLLFNPFEFPNLNRKLQRDFLLKYFAQATDLPEDTAPLREKMKSLKQEAAGVPYQILEVQRQLDDLPTGDFAELETLLSGKQSELANLQTKDFAREEKFLTEQIHAFERRREDLLTRYRTPKTTCPTCGQTLPKAKIVAARNNILTEGKQVAATIERLKNELETLQSKANITIERALKIKQLQDEIRDMTKRIAALQTAQKLRKRLADLVDREKFLNAKLVELEGQIASAQLERQRRITESEANVNAQFEHVRFKLFKVLANGDIKEDCEAMINGVPYSSLSKGEKLKAALDIFRSLQEKFQLEMPLFLDDAESYTSNSFVTIPNQKFLFRVTEADLKVSVDEMRRAA